MPPVTLYARPMAHTTDDYERKLSILSEMRSHYERTLHDPYRRTFVNEVSRRIGSASHELRTLNEMKMLEQL
ncbi:hypothetical protein WS85_12865 [Burkholderia anthina]|nr:hypothetical protein WS85_12865 [Burkholderia anthina]KVX39309.1 hypothetical protein WT32_06810 [Burkholderia anthina]